MANKMPGSIDNEDPPVMKMRMETSGVSSVERQTGTCHRMEQNETPWQHTLR